MAFLLFESSPDQRLLLTLLVAGACAAGWGRCAPGFLVRGWLKLANSRALALAVVFFVSLSAVSSLAIRRGVPLPYVHDEFSYLLAADTFARGRLTNPSPRLWAPFESMHILVRPSYQSKYPPGQGLFMALGQVTTGRPIAGVWLSTALAAVAFCWAMYAVVPPRYALLGGLLACVHPQLLEWGQRYWGASVPALGGALLFGSMLRLLPPRQPRSRDAFLFALGLIILALSRPYEGLVLAILLTIALAWNWLRDAGRAPLALLRAPLAAALVTLLAGGAWLGYYNYRVTGDPLRLPYVEHQAQYGSVPLFIFQDRLPRKTYLNKELEHFLVHEQEYWYARRGSWYELAKEAMRDLTRLKDGAFGNVESLALPLLLLPWLVWKNRTARWLTIGVLLFTAGLLVETYCFAHYAAPLTAVVGGLVLVCLRRLWRLGRPVGALLARLSVGLFLLWAILWWRSFYEWKQEGFAVARHRVASQLASTPGRHLVIVRYSAHNVHEEWVYNAADLESAKVVWAREMDEARNRELLGQYEERRAWLLEADAVPPRLVEYPDGRN